MSSPRHPDGPDERPGEDGGWHEPVHLGGNDGSGRPLPGGSAEFLPPDVPSSGRAGGDPTLSPPPLGAERKVRGATGGGWWHRRGRPEVVPVDEADPGSAQAWAPQLDWSASDGTGPEDTVLAELIAAGPVRLGREARPAGVMRDRAHGLELVAFDVVYPVGRRLVPRYAVTAAPVLARVPRLRLSPARLWKHRTGGLLQVPSGDAEFDLRWTLLAEEDGPQVRRIVQDPTLRGLLMASDDGDEFWTAAGHVAAIRPDGHRPMLLEHHTRLLAAAVGALSVPW